MPVDLRFESWDDFRGSWLKRVHAAQTAEFSARRPGDEFRVSKRFIFRGQPSAGFPLRSSFDRVMVEHGKGRNDYIDRRYDSYMAELMRSQEEAGFASSRSRNQIDIETAAKAQHLGLPTRLLDWSKSPYVAAFFAFAEPDAQFGEHAAIWCLDLERVLRESVVRKTDVFIHHSQVQGNLRQAAQTGVFTLNQTSEIDLEKVFTSTSQFMRRDPWTEVLFKMIIPRSCRPEIIDELDLMRINFLSLFPDEDGVIRYMRWRLFGGGFTGDNDIYMGRR